MAAKSRYPGRIIPDMDPTLFLADLEAKPASLARLADAFRSGDPLADVPASPQRVLLMGMGSSRYAARVDRAPAAGVRR